MSCSSSLRPPKRFRPRPCSRSMRILRSCSLREFICRSPSCAGSRRSRKCSGEGMAKRVDETNFWPRGDVDKTAWVECAEALGRGEGELFALFAEMDRVHMALRGAGDEATRIITVKVEEGRYPSVGVHHAPAIRPERAIRDLFGFEPQGRPDTRPCLDHAKWAIT